MDIKSNNEDLLKGRKKTKHDTDWWCVDGIDLLAYSNEEVYEKACEHHTPEVIRVSK